MDSPPKFNLSLHLGGWDFSTLGASFGCNTRQEQGEPAYSGKTVDDPARRFEKPERKNHWDSLLFELKPVEEQIQESSSAILEAVSFLTRKIDSKSRDVHILQPTIATQNVSVYPCA